MWRKYYRPQSVAEALAVLQEYAGRARVLAGGTDLMVQLPKGDISFEAAVDITSIRELRYIREDKGSIFIGALSTHTDLAESHILQEKATLLADAARSVGSLQIRNVGTVGGNVVNAQPAADTAIVLMALDAVVTVASLQGLKHLPLENLYQAQGGVSIDPTRELLTGISFASPYSAGGGAAFGRVARRKALSLPVFNTAVVLIPVAGSSRMQAARIVMGPVALMPLRARAGEKILLENGAGEGTFQQAAAAAAAEAAPRDSVFRGSAAYRRQLARVVVYRTLQKAWEEVIG